MNNKELNKFKAYSKHLSNRERKKIIAVLTYQLDVMEPLKPGEFGRCV